MVIGGSLGARSLNEAVARNLPQILAKYQLIHIAGKNGFNPELQGRGYVQYEYVDTELKDLMALADIVVSRAGSNSIFELASLYKPMILVPLPAASSRGEQSLNAKALLTKATLKSSATKISLILKFCSRCWIRFMPDVPPIPKKCAKTRSKSLLPPRFANKSVPLPHRHKICLSGTTSASGAAPSLPADALPVLLSIPGTLFICRLRFFVRFQSFLPAFCRP